MGVPGAGCAAPPVSEFIGGGGLRGEVKHLSTRRRGYSVSSGERKRRRLNRGRVITRQGLRLRGCGARLGPAAVGPRCCWWLAGSSGKGGRRG